MKIITFRGGLGNQLFQYMFLHYLQKQSPPHRIYIFLHKNALKEHNNFEINKWFDLDLPKTNKFISALCYCIYGITSLASKFSISLKLITTDHQRSRFPLIYDGFWQDKKYISTTRLPKFKSTLTLSPENTDLLHKISETNSVAIHIRRGDYVKSETNRMRYGNICTSQYYTQAIEMIQKDVHTPYYFIFSDDLEFVEQTLHLENMIIVSCNRKENSFYDMYLMAHCKHMILANSTFSCWAAYLNPNKGIIISPSRWTNEPSSPNLSLDDWKII